MSNGGTILSFSAENSSHYKLNYIFMGNPGMCYRNLIDSVTPSNGGRYYEQVKMIIQKQVIKRIKQIKKDIYMKTYLNIIELHNLSISMSEAGTCNALRK